MKTIIVLLLLLGVSAPTLQAQQRARMRVDPAIPTYKPLQAVQGSLTLIGDESCEAVVQQWIGPFTRIHPGATITTLGKGSSYAPPALLDGTTSVVMMDRELTPAERDAFEKKFTTSPSGFPSEFRGSPSW